MFKSLFVLPLTVLLLSTFACNDDHTKKDLRAQVELKDHQKNFLQTELSSTEARDEAARLALENESAAKDAALKGLNQSLFEKNQSIATLSQLVTTDDQNLAVSKAQLTEDKMLAANEKAEFEKQLAHKNASLVAAQASAEESKANEAKLLDAINDLSSDINKKNDQIQSLNQQLKNSGSETTLSATLKAQLMAAQKDLAVLQDAKVKVDADLLASRAVIGGTMDLLWGMFYTEDSKLMINKVTCNQLLYVKENGESVSAIACEDGKIQWEKRSPQSFATVSEASGFSDYGFRLESSVTESSCKATANNMYNAGTSVNFDRVSKTVATDFALYLSTELNKDSVRLTNTSAVFKAAECDIFLADAARGEWKGTKQEGLFNMIVEVCKVAAGAMDEQLTKNSGCFKSNNTFSK
ncbi:MAG: hypothetical protein H7249_14950 [Chitinophagaceae bacterium]|nr:hypothetical protein [Oligoflexus sp.]